MITESPRGPLLDDSLRVMIRAQRAMGWPSMTPEEREQWRGRDAADGTPGALLRLGFPKCPAGVD